MTQRDDLERGIHRLGADVALGSRARPGLLEVFAGQDAKGDRHRKRLGEPREGARDGVCEHVEMGSLAADQAPKGDDGVEAAGLRDGRDGRRELERTRDLELLDRRPSGTRLPQGALRQGPGYVFVPTCTHDCHAGSDKCVSHLRGRLPTLRHLSQSSPRMAFRRVAA